jgi:WD40 repeat protein
VVCISFSPDGKVLAAGTYEPRVRLWDAQDWQELPSVGGHSSGVFHLAFSRDGKFLATGSGIWTDRFLVGEIKIWSTAAWRLVRTLYEHSDRVHALAFLPDSLTLVSGSTDGSLGVWDLRDQARNVPLNIVYAHDTGVRSLAVSPIDNAVVSGGADRAVRLWTTMDLLGVPSNPDRWKQHGSILLDLAFTDRGAGICTSDLAGTVVVQDVESREKLFEFQGKDSVVYVAVNDPKHLLALLGETSIRVYSSSTGALLWSWNLPYRCTNYDCMGRGHDFSPGGDELAVGSGDSLYFFDAQTGTLRRRLGPIGPDLASRWSVRYSPDGRYLAAARDRIYLVDLRSARVVEYDTQGHRPYAICFSPDGDQLATAGFDGLIWIWDCASGKALGTCVGHTDVVSSVDYSADGRRLLSASRDSSVRIWDTKSRECLMTMSEHQGEVFSARFSPDNRLVASCGEGRSVILRYADTSKQFEPEAR